MMMLGIIIFVFCTWAIFSKHFCDGLITKHFLIFAAITAMLTIVDPVNTLVGITSALLFMAGLSYWLYNHRHKISAYWQLINH